MTSTLTNEQKLAIPLNVLEKHNEFMSRSTDEDQREIVAIDLVDATINLMDTPVLDGAKRTEVNNEMNMLAIEYMYMDRIGSDTDEYTLLTRLNTIMKGV